MDYFAKVQNMSGMASQSHHSFQFFNLVMIEWEQNRHLCRCSRGNLRRNDVEGMLISQSGLTSLIALSRLVPVEK